MSSSFMQRKERAVETWKGEIMNQILHWQSRPQAFHQHLEVAAKARRSSYLKVFSPNSISLSRLERVKLKWACPLTLKKPKLFK